MAQVLVGKFNIPDDMAKELSDLLAKKTIKEDLMVGVAIKKEYEAFEDLENQLIPVIKSIEAIKHKITAEFVPEEFRSDKYVWNYDGYEVDGPVVGVYENQ